MTDVKKSKPKAAPAVKRSVSTKSPATTRPKDASDIEIKHGSVFSAEKPHDLSLRKKELIERVVTRSGIKKKDAKPVIEAMLAELGETIASERAMVLPPLGKLSVNRQKDLPNGRILIVKIRQRDTSTISDIAEPNKEQSV